MKIEDLTILFLTANKVPEKWAEFHRKKLIEAVGSTDIIAFSYKELDFGIENIIQTEYSLSNIYKQMYKGANLSKTKYIAIVDDDTLYPAQHFNIHRPPENKIAYNYNRWHILAWKPTYYFHKPRPGNGLMIAPKELMIKILEDRFKYVNESGNIIHKALCELGVKRSDNTEIDPFYSYHPVVSFYHTESIDDFNQRKRKKSWPVQAFDLPIWGHVKDLAKNFM